jgi:hypothetical protein
MRFTGNQQPVIQLQLGARADSSVLASIAMDGVGSYHWLIRNGGENVGCPAHHNDINSGAAVFVILGGCAT